MSHPPIPTVSLLRGDGIGPEITDAALAIVEAAGAQLRYEEVPAGESALRTEGTPLPERTLASIERNRVALKGPLSTPKGEGFRSVNVALRQHFDLYANVRPSRTLPGVPSRYQGIDIVIVRENTEDIYAGIEHFVGPGRSAAESIAIITRVGSERIVRYAFEYARKHGRNKVTLVHKANILKMSNGLFLEVGRAVAADYPEIAFVDVIVDAACMMLVTAPERFDVIVTTNLFGDILSDLVAGLVGGLGVSPGANLGERAAIFEAVHGTAPDIAGRGVANPTALTLAGAMMLDHLGQTTAAERVRQAVYAALQDERLRTPDLGGRGDTRTFTRGVIALMK
ncbi:MAG: isocitrate/isopropylmalate family dehydrogenase [Myxococcales bacterium]|nr:isocitrate/isopropylmalate family dehydrogenase [Myxococcota bacterium]MDW8281176.1 isocitrate/isopropylmalate family dehydrogenase [Myxococcales bacterium]